MQTNLLYGQPRVERQSLVKKNKAGISIEQFHPHNGRIHNVESMISHSEDAREQAKRLAKTEPAARDRARRRLTASRRR